MRTLRGRLIAAFTAVAIGALVVAGAVALAFSSATARDDAFADLREQARAVERLVVGLAATAEGFDLDRPTRAALLRALRLQDVAVVGIAATGDLIGLPDGIDPSDLDVDRLLAGEALEGSEGSFVFVAQPLAVPPDPPARRPGAPAPPRSAIVMTRDVPTVDLGGLGPYLLAGAAIAVVTGAGLGTLLARRLTRPLQATEAAARSIAAGDLSARVGSEGRADAELAAVADAFDEMAEELERSRSLTRDFLMSVSHDLRTPLTSIRGYAEALGEGGAATDDAERHKAAGVIESEARRLERLVSDLLDLARLDARRFSLEPEPVDLAGVVDAVASGFQPAADSYGIDLVIDARAVPERQLDPHRLGQITANLVENALKYATSRVEVTTRPIDADPDGEGRGGGKGAGRDVVLTVRDDGPGIPAHETDRIFERLYTSTRGEGRQVGTGLGLAIVHELVSAMGGRVDVESPPEGGAVFRVRLP